MQKLTIEEMKRLSAEEYHQAPKRPVQLLLDNIRSLQNVGSMFRTADAFRMEKLWLTGFTGRPPHREINRTALGATETVDWEHRTDAGALVDELVAAGWQPWALEQAHGSIPLGQFQPDPRGKYLLIVGNEVEGVQQALMDRVAGSLEIPQAGTKHSLNVSVSAGIALWHFSQALRL